MSAFVRQFEHSLAWFFFGIGMNTDLFHACGHCWVFHMLEAYIVKEEEQNIAQENIV